MRERDRGERRMVLRAPLGYRILFPLFGAFFLWVDVSPWEDSQGFWSDLPIRTFGFTLAVAFLVLPFRPRVELLPDRVVARGLLFSRAIALPDLVDVEPSYGGLTLVEGDGRTFTVTGVGENWNLAALLGTTTRADRLADRLRVAAEHHHACEDAGAVDHAAALPRHRAPIAACPDGSAPKARGLRRTRRRNAREP